MHLMRNGLFLLKSTRVLLPGNRYRKLRRHADPNYVHDRDKHPLRNKHHGAEGWQSREVDGLTYRDYGDYDQYVTHQRQKLLEILKAHGGFSTKVVLRQRYDFWRRFQSLTLPKDARIMCLGARLGTEVEVLRDLGYTRAIGTDLEPGPDNPYVEIGDFMNIDAETSSVDMIYCNAVDHAFDLERFFKEHARVLKPNGLAMYDISTGPPGSFEAVHWGDERDLIALMLTHFKQLERVGIDGDWKTICLRGKRDAFQVAAAGTDEARSETTGAAHDA